LFAVWAHFVELAGLIVLINLHSLIDLDILGWIDMEGSIMLVICCLLLQLGLIILVKLVHLHYLVILVGGTVLAILGMIVRQF
jgi:hypothetical protein